jgi:glycosyltransferase involved in cell wall biosynthesis
MRILFLNQYFPPDHAPTGVLLRELADELERSGHTVDFVAAREDYRAGQKRGGRMIREAKALARMFWDGLHRPRADVVISASSPPCLLIVATLIAFWHRAKSVHWIMDLYPEIAVALGEIREGFVSRCIAGLMGWCYRRAARVVALDDDMAARLRRYRVECAVIRPWVFATVLPQVAAAKAEPTEEWTWIYSGNLGRAHEWETLLQAQALLEQRGVEARLLFQGGGPSREAAQARARELGLKRCAWTGYVEEAELPNSLLRGRALAVTQLPAAQGLLWPSKMGLVLSLSRPILWVGPVDGAIARMLGAFPHAGVFAPGQGKEIADWLAHLRAQGGTVAADRVFDPAAHRTGSIAAWMELFRQF